MSSLARFRRVLTEQTICLNFYGTDSDLEYFKDYVGFLDWKEKVGVKSTGIHEHNGRLLYVDNETAVAADGTVDDTIVQLERYVEIESDILKKSPITDMNDLAFIGSHILGYNEYIKTVPILAWIAALFLQQGGLFLTNETFSPSQLFTYKGGFIMKKIISLLITASLIFSLTSCVNKKSVDINFVISFDDVFDYSLQEAVAFTVDNEDIYVAFRNQPEIKKYDKHGKETGSYDLGEGYHANLCVYNDKLYTSTYTDQGLIFTEYSFSEKEYSVYSIDYEITGVLGMVIMNNTIFMVGWEDTDAIHSCNDKSHEHGISDNVHNHDSIFYDDYINMGEVALSIELDTFKINKIDIENIVNLGKYMNDKILYYAYDISNGYYFTVYDPVKQEFSEKTYNNLGYLFSYAYADVNDSIIFYDHKNGKLTSASKNDSAVRVDLLSHTVTASGNDIVYSNNFYYILDGKNGNIYRTEYKQAVNIKEIEIIYSTEYMNDPFGCGYAINTSVLDYQEFVLRILARDSDYDICMMNSKQIISRNIRDKGSFYPLNDLPMVQEYLDTCFPYLKEAATNDNGDIWMLPIEVNIPHIIYNPSNCLEKGVDFNKDYSLEELFEIANRLYSEPDLHDKYQLNAYQVQAYIINQYNSQFAPQNGKYSYDTVLFRKICEMLKRATASDSLFTWIKPPGAAFDLDDYYSDYLFTLEPYQFNAFDLSAYNNLRASALPVINNETVPSPADVVFLCVNPYSKNLNDTLNFINSYCAYMMMRNDIFMFDNKEIYPFSDTQLANDLYNIYSNAEVCFELSPDIFWNDYLDYKNDKIDIERLITEITRKTNMAVGE